MGGRTGKLYAGFTLALLATYLVLPEAGWWTAAWQVGGGYVAVAAIILAARRHASADRIPWMCFAIGIAANVSGIAVDTYTSEYLKLQFTVSPAEPFYLALYPAVALGLALMIRRRSNRRDWAALVDTTTITTGLGLLAWVVVIRPAATDAALPLLTRAVQVSYPVGDLILLAMIVRLLRGGGTRSAAHRWMASSVGAFLLGDTAWAVYGATGADPTGLSLRVLSGVFVMAYSLLAMAALHPAAREISQPMPPAEPRLSVVQLVTLAMVSLIAPAILAVQVYQQATSGERITDGGAIVIGSSALFLLVVVRMAQLLREVEKQALKVRHLARSDELTGLPNRRAWNDEIPRALEQACRDNTPVCVAMLDLDRFKAFNDTYGHPAGDRLLKSAAAAWHSALRTVDTLARYGGEEFVVLLPNVHPDQASAILARVKAATPLGQTFSAGLATWDGSENSDALIARADKALYAAKSSGRDRIVVACDNNDPALTPA